MLSFRLPRFSAIGGRNLVQLLPMNIILRHPSPLNAAWCSVLLELKSKQAANAFRTVTYGHVTPQLIFFSDKAKPLNLKIQSLNIPHIQINIPNEEKKNHSCPFWRQSYVQAAPLGRWTLTPQISADVVTQQPKCQLVENNSIKHIFAWNVWLDLKIYEIKTVILFSHAILQRDTARLTEPNSL